MKEDDHPGEKRSSRRTPQRTVLILTYEKNKNKNKRERHISKLSGKKDTIKASIRLDIVRFKKIYRDYIFFTRITVTFSNK